MFAAALILLSNEFSNLYVSPSADVFIANSIAIMTYCAETDPQAQRLLFILTTFRDVVASRQDQQRPRLVSQAEDPMTSFFSAPPSTKLEQRAFDGASDGPAMRPANVSRSDSLPGELSIITHPLTTGSDGASANDEAIDFDALWPWPGGAGAPQASAPAFDAGVQGISDSAVPLFGVRDPD